MFARRSGVRRSRLLVAAAGAAVVVVPGATAKDFGPGDLRVCGAAGRCVPVVDAPVLPLLGSFYYSGPQPARAGKPRLGTPYFELRFRNGYVTGIVATARVDRFLSYGVYLGRFARGTWYGLPSRMAEELRTLSRTLTPLRLTRRAVAKSR
jgi:hypothetical protein